MKTTKTDFYILIGGKSSRMGHPKHLLELKGMSLLDWQIDRFRDFSRHFFILGHKNQKTVDDSSTESTFIPDHTSEIGPLGGIFTALSLKNFSGGIFLGVDLIFPPVELKNHLFPANPPDKSHYFITESGKIPLCFFLSPDLKGITMESIFKLKSPEKEKGPSVREFLEQIEGIPHPLTFTPLDLNCPEQWQEFARKIGEGN